MAGGAQDAPAAPRLPEDEQRHEPAGLSRARPTAAPGQRLNAPHAGRRDHADDAFRRCRRAALRRRRRRTRWPPFEATTRELPGERSAEQQRGHRCASPAGRASWSAGAADWVRSGILSLRQRRPTTRPTTPRAGSPAAGHDAAREAHRPAGSLQPAISVGYGSAFTCQAPMRIGVVACGYADGYPCPGWLGPTGTPVLVNGVRTRTVGRVSMDMLTVDLTALPAGHASAPRSPCGATARTAACCRWTRWPARPAPFPTSCCVRSRRGCRCRSRVQKAETMRG
jgi:hypothetical protein